MRVRVLLILIGAGATALSGACNGDSDRSSTHIRVIDSTYTESWQPMEDTGTVYRIEVVSPLGADTVRNVIPPAPNLPPASGKTPHRNKPDTRRRLVFVSGSSRLPRWALPRLRRRGYHARKSRHLWNRARSQDRRDRDQRTGRWRLRLR